MKIKFCGICSVGLIVALVLAAAANAQTTQTARDATFDIDIPAESLGEALQTLALTLHHKLLYSSELVEGKGSQALKGTFTAEEALRRLLSGTNLSYEVTTGGLVLIRAASGTSRNSGIGAGQGAALVAQADPPANTQAM